MMERQVGHLTRIVDDLLDVARITRGSIELQCERLDLARLVRETFEDRRRLLEEASLEPRLDVHESTIWVMGDHTRLTQAIANVLDNAAKFTPAGGKVTVRLLMDEHEREALLVVHDSGIGIAPEVLPRVFDVFAQADRSLARTRGGLGLGLTVARSIIELHGGTIEAASEGEGRGAKFVIRFPALVESPALAKQLATSPATHRLRVLIIEDNRDSAEMLRLLLEAAGHEVAVAHTGPDGVNAAHAFEPHVVVCDIGLPGMDGFEVAETLRQDPAMASARLLAVTGYGSEADRLRTVRAGFDAHLVKPVDPEALLAQLALGARALVTS
jgi:CheY-like chemotaxis protein/two-component sensor histidine kinase